MTTKALQNKTQLLSDLLARSVARMRWSHQPRAEPHNDVPMRQCGEANADAVDTADRNADDVLSSARLLQDAAAPLAKSSAFHSDNNSERDNKRVSKRKPAHLAGHICNEGSSTMVDVIIKDLSGNGARFTLDRGKSSAFSATPAIAEQFHLYITYDRMFVRCKLQWRNGDAFGVRYLAAPQFY